MSIGKNTGNGPEVDIEKEFSEEELENKQRQLNKQFNYNSFVQKVDAKQVQGQKAENESESEAEDNAAAVAAASAEN